MMSLTALNNRMMIAVRAMGRLLAMLVSINFDSCRNLVFLTRVSKTNTGALQ